MYVSLAFFDEAWLGHFMLLDILACFGRYLISFKDRHSLKSQIIQRMNCKYANIVTSLKMFHSCTCRVIDAHAVELLGLRYDYKVVEIVVSTILYTAYIFIIELIMHVLKV